MESFNKIKALVADVEADVIKAEAGNASAVQRARKVMQEIKNLCKPCRDELQATKKAK